MRQLLVIVSLVCIQRKLAGRLWIGACAYKLVGQLSSSIIESEWRRSIGQTNHFVIQLMLIKSPWSRALFVFHGKRRVWDLALIALLSCYIIGPCELWSWYNVLVSTLVSLLWVRLLWKLEHNFTVVESLFLGCSPTTVRLTIKPV
jgi:hypothetical protein